MSKEGYLQIKMRETNEKIDELDLKIQPLELKITKYEELIKKIDFLQTYVNELGKQVGTEASKVIKNIYEENTKRNIKEMQDYVMQNIYSFKKDVQSMLDRLTNEIAVSCDLHASLEAYLIKKGIIDLEELKKLRIAEGKEKLFLTQLKKANTLTGKFVKGEKQ